MTGSLFGYVPYLRPGTLALTAIACGYLASGNAVSKRKLLEFCGNRSGRTRHLFGEGVVSTARHLFGSSLAPAEVLRRHTLFGIYSRALSSPSADTWAAQIISGSATRWTRSPIGMSSVRMNFKLVTDELRSCASCMQQDIEESGFASWHLVHLIPALHHCPHHGDLLIPEECGWRNGIWMPHLPTGVGKSRSTQPFENTSEGYVSYLRLWAALAEGRLSIANSQNWPMLMHFAATRLGGLDNAVQAISRQLMRSWNTRMYQFPEMLRYHVLPDFVRNELQYSTSQNRIAQKLVILTACDALGVLPQAPDLSAQLNIQFRQKVIASTTAEP